MHIPTFRSASRQTGAVLFIALVFLVLIMLLTLTATSTSILQEKMTGGMRNHQLSNVGADSALRGAETWLWTLSFKADAAAGGQPLPPCAPNSSGTCVHRTDTQGLLKTDVQSFRSSRGWVNSPGGTPGYNQSMTGLSGDAATASLALQPVFIVEDMGPNVPPSLGQQTGAIDSELSASAGKQNYYRITARSQGGSAAAQTVVESVFSSMDNTNTGTN